MRRKKGRYREAEDDLDIGCSGAGEGIDLIHAIEPACAIVAHIVAEAEAALVRRFA
jgi:hypothetical protein